MTRVNFRARGTAIYFVTREERRSLSRVGRPCGSLESRSHPNAQESFMRHQLRASVLALALLGTAGMAAAQQSGSSSQSNVHLTPTQQSSVSQGLASQPSQAAPSGYQAQVGSKPPSGMQAHPMPNNVSAAVPEVKQLYFIKTPDRILLIDPDTQIVAEMIVDDGATTGSAGRPSTGSSSGSSGSGAPGSGNR
jgi:hypothetical protein